MQAYDSPELLPQRAPTSGSEMPTASQQQSTQTSLPPIRLLHPFLDPPSGMSQHMGPSSTSYEYPSGTTHYPPLPQPMSDTHPPLLKRELQPEIYGGVDSEAEGYDSQHGPQANAKRKRRRQALSCTECKRRKIKCDRNQPCAPCTRRSEQAKCQWHIVEPVEKYVTRAEYEELKARFDQLSELVHRLLASQSMPYYQPMPSQPQPGPSAETTHPYQGYPSMLPPHHTYQPHLEHGPPSVVQAGPSSHRYSRPEDGQSPARTIGPVAASSPAIPTIQSPLQARSQLSGAKSPAPAGATTARRSPHSLASITSTYNTEPSESKNYSAQTLKLGERLRRDPSRALEDSALLFIVLVRLLRLPVLTLPPFRECLWMARRLLANHTIFTHRGQVGG